MDILQLGEECFTGGLGAMDPVWNVEIDATLQSDRAIARQIENTLLYFQGGSVFLPDVQEPNMVAFRIPLFESSGRPCSVALDATFG